MATSGLSKRGTSYVPMLNGTVAPNRRNKPAIITRAAAKANAALVPPKKTVATGLVIPAVEKKTIFFNQTEGRVGD